MANYRDIVKHYEACFAKHGDSHLGMDWPDQHDATTRYRVMLDLIPKDSGQVTLLDFGCGV